MNGLIEIDRVKVIDIGGTPYMQIPRFMRREQSPIGGEAVFLKSADESDVVVRIDMPTSDHPGADSSLGKKS